MDRDTFRRKRERLGLTQEEMAKRLDMNRGTIIRYESGEITLKPMMRFLLFMTSRSKMLCRR